jgi:DNA-binding transcriptional regulator YdaS (Cro superfamily)
MGKGKIRNLCNIEAIKKAIIIFGSADKTARKLELTTTTVHNWNSGRTVPNPINCILIEKITNGTIKRSDILPHYDWKKLF